MQTTNTASVPQNSDPANPQDVGSARSPGHTTIRDRSAQEPWLPIEKTTWDNWRFMLRARRVRVSGPEKLKLKLFYLAMASFTDSLLKGVDIGQFTLPLIVMLHDLQLAAKTFYKLRRELRTLGLLDWKQRRNRSTEYRVFACREWAAAVPDPAGMSHSHSDRRSVKVTDRDRYRLPTYLDLCRSTESTSNAAANSRVQADEQQQQRETDRLRLKAMIQSCEISHRKLGLTPFESEWHREEIRTGKLTLEAMQEFTNELHAKRPDRRRR